MSDGLLSRLQDMVVAHYDSAAGLALYRRRADEGLRPWEQAVRDEYLPQPAATLVLGCGGGREAFALERQGYEVIGVDRSQALVAVACSLASERGSAVRFVVSDGSGVPVDDRCVRYVVAWGQVLGNVPGRSQRLALLRDLWRVLEPGGLLSLSVHDRERTLEQARRRGMLDANHGLQLEPGDVVTREPEDAGGRCYWHYFTRGELEQLVAEAGFELVTCRRGSHFNGRDNLWVAVCRRPGTTGEGCPA